jgi:cell division cycle 20-like protein 1 (cofactor of APC complex)
MQCVDTGSQVCNLAWSKHSSELVSTHGYSQNQIIIWKYSSLAQGNPFSLFILLSFLF